METGFPPWKRQNTGGPLSFDEFMHEFAKRPRLDAPTPLLPTNNNNIPHIPNFLSGPSTNNNVPQGSDADNAMAFMKHVIENSENSAAGLEKFLKNKFIRKYLSLPDIPAFDQPPPPSFVEPSLPRFDSLTPSIPVPNWPPMVPPAMLSAQPNQQSPPFSVNPPCQQPQSRQSSCQFTGPPLLPPVVQPDWFSTTAVSPTLPLAPPFPIPSTGAVQNPFSYNPPPLTPLPLATSSVHQPQVTRSPSTDFTSRELDQMFAVFINQIVPMMKSQTASQKQGHVQRSMSTENIEVPFSPQAKSVRPFLNVEGSNFVKVSRTSITPPTKILCNNNAVSVPQISSHSNFSVPPLPPVAHVRRPPFKPTNSSSNRNRSPSSSQNAGSAPPFIPCFPPPPVMPDVFSKIFQTYKSDTTEASPSSETPAVHRSNSMSMNRNPQCSNNARSSNSGHQENRQAVKYSCDACSRYFWRKEDFDHHMLDRITCPYPGCTFSAHEETIEAHFANTHARGFHIKLDTPEEIAKWRKDRKAKFPTNENVAKKDSERKARVARGEALATRSYTNKKCVTSTSRDESHQATKSNAEIPVKNEANVPSAFGSKQQTPFVPLTCRQKYLSKFTRPSDVVPRTKVEVVQSDDSDSGPDEAPIVSASATTSCNTSSQVQPIEDIKPEIPTEAPARNQRRTFRRKATLLEMLLAPDIRHERNVLLQAMLFIEQNKFFDT